AGPGGGGTITTPAPNISTPAQARGGRPAPRLLASCAMARAPPGPRLLLLLGGSVGPFALGGLLVRWLGPRGELRGRGFIMTPSGEHVPNSEIYHFMARRGDVSDEGEGPRGHLQPNLETRMGYEQPRWSYYDRDGCITIKNNSLGFRDDEFPVQK